MTYIKHTAISFLNKHHLTQRKITYKRLQMAARKNGYIVKSYSSSHSAMILLNVYERAMKSSSVSVIDSDNNICIFIDDSLPKPKQLFALVHEIGHIVLNHNPNDNRKHCHEREANLFAHYLLDSDYDIKRLKSAILYTLGIMCLCFAVVFCILGIKNVPSPSQNIASAEPPEVSAPIIIINNTPSVSSKETSTQEKQKNPPQNEQQFTFEEDFICSSIEDAQDTAICYFTRYGEVYHLYEDCSYLNRSNEIYCDTIENSHKDRLCSRCLNK